MLKPALYLLILLLTGCTSSTQDSNTVITGSLGNLPDGILYFVGEDLAAIDSVKTINGNFNITLSPSRTGDNVYLTFKHRSKADNIIRLFSFNTKNRYGTGELNMREVIVGDSITMEGKITERSPDFLIKQGIISALIDSVVIGKQTRVMHNLDYNFSTPLISSFAVYENFVKKYPYSFYLLHELNKYKHGYSTDQLGELLKLFLPNVRNRKDALEIEKSIVLRKNNRRTIVNTKFLSFNGAYESCIDSTAKLNMIILWASWCNPCIAEIHDLQAVYSKYGLNKNFKMVSVSLDRKKSDWMAAAQKYNMPWRQLWVQNDLSTYAKDIFQFDGGIPYVLFVDYKGTILRRFTGFNVENLKRYTNTIDELLYKN